MKKNSSASWKKLYKQAYSLWKEVCFLRDGRECQVQKRFPMTTPHSEVLQVDHCISRDNKHFHLDPRNGTVVCSSCNASKSWNSKSIGKLIDHIVMSREGPYFDHMVKVDSSGVPNLDFKTDEYMEEMIQKLTKIKERK